MEGNTRLSRHIFHVMMCSRYTPPLMATSLVRNGSFHSAVPYFSVRVASAILRRVPFQENASAPVGVPAPLKIARTASKAPVIIFRYRKWCLAALFSCLSRLVESKTLVLRRSSSHHQRTASAQPSHPSCNPFTPL